MKQRLTVIFGLNSLLFYGLLSCAYAKNDSSEQNSLNLNKLLNDHNYLEKVLSKKDPIVHTSKVSDKLWPKVTIFTKISGSCDEIAGLFAAFDYQKNYVPGLLKSKIYKEEILENKSKVEVSYVMDMPWPLSDSHYIHGHILTRPAKETYKVSWYMVQSDSAENVEGYALFAPSTQDNQCIHSYETHITPKSFVAGVFKDFMVRDVLKSVNVFKDHFAKLKKQKSPVLQKYARIIKKLSQGKSAYFKK